jgi:ribulose-5-phosphate 4-epimerase/fuculose-1-phosphate aldolase
LFPIISREIWHLLKAFANLHANAVRYYSPIMGRVVSGRSIDDAVDSAEELEATAEIALLLERRRIRKLTRDHIAALEAAFPS